MLEIKNYTSEEIKEIDNDLSEKLGNLSKIIGSPTSNDKVALPENAEEIIKNESCTTSSDRFLLKSRRLFS